MFGAVMVGLRRYRGLWRANDTTGAVLLCADETYKMLPPLPLSDLRRLIGSKTIMIDIRGTEPSKPTVLIVANEGEGPKRFNRRATILLRGAHTKYGDAVFGNAIVTQILNPNGRLMRRATKANPCSRIEKIGDSPIS
jgi:hypothetical protein